MPPRNPSFTIVPIVEDRLRQSRLERPALEAHGLQIRKRARGFDWHQTRDRATALGDDHFAPLPNVVEEARQILSSLAHAGFSHAIHCVTCSTSRQSATRIFSVYGLPDIKVHALKPEKKDAPIRYQVELLGLDTFDPTTMDADHRPGSDVPMWMLDGDYNDLCFHVSQAFFPRTGAWNDLRKALKGDSATIRTVCE